MIHNLKDNMGIVFHAIPDSSKIIANLNSNGTPEFIFPNRISLSNEHRSYLKDKSVNYWYAKNRKTPRINNISWAINTLADADEYTNALEYLDQIGFGKIPIFNSPRAVYMSRRDLSYQLLKNVEGLSVPKCIRIKCDNVEDLKKHFHMGDFTYPVLVRPEKSQTGRNLFLIKGPDDWSHVPAKIWCEDYLFLTQYVDTKNENGIFYKVRVVFVNGEVFIRHIKISEEWKVHNANSKGTDFSVREEMELIEHLYANKEFINVCKQIPIHTGMDYFGADIGLQFSKKQYVLFEANPAMTIFYNYKTKISAERQERQSSLEKPISYAILKHINSPNEWGRLLPKLLKYESSSVKNMKMNVHVTS